MTMFSLTEDTRGQSLSIFYSDGESETIPETHVSFKAIIEKLLSGKANDEEIRDLTGVLKTVAKKMSALSERVSVDGKDVYFDGDPLRGEIADLIKKMFEEGRALDFKPLVNFLEKAATNPSLKSIDDLYRWISKGDLVIDPDGDIVAYKAVRVDENGISTSIHEGSAFVNGEEIIGHVPNRPGTVISMARSLVVDDPHIGCSIGLHAGTYAYARQFQRWNSRYTTRLILVKINPRDVVSVPHDEADQKMRVARYTVLSEIEERLADVIYQPEAPLFVDDEEDEDYCECGCMSEDAPDLDWDSYADWEKELLDPERAEREQAEAKEEEPEDTLVDAIRDKMGRFTKAAGQLMQRDSKGRFVTGGK